MRGRGHGAINRPARRLLARRRLARTPIGRAWRLASLRSAWDRSIRRCIVVVEGEYIACQTWIEGRFVREFSQSPVGLLPPNGEKVTWDLSNIFRVDERGRLIDEWVRTDNRSVLRQLGI